MNCLPDLPGRGVQLEHQVDGKDPGAQRSIDYVVLYGCSYRYQDQFRGFIDASFVFGHLENYLTWPTDWSFMISILPAVWTMGTFDSRRCQDHFTRDLGVAARGLLICIVYACIKRRCVCGAQHETGMVMAQVVMDSLEKMGCVHEPSGVVAPHGFFETGLSCARRRLAVLVRIRQGVESDSPGAVACDDFLCGFRWSVGSLDPHQLRRATALFSLSVASNWLSWRTYFVGEVAHGCSQTVSSGPVIFGQVARACQNCELVDFLCHCGFIFPDYTSVNKQRMNYTLVINRGVWFLALVYYFAYGHRYYTGPKSNLEFVETVDIDAELEKIDWTGAALGSGFECRA